MRSWGSRLLTDTGIGLAKPDCTAEMGLTAFFGVGRNLDRGRMSAARHKAATMPPFGEMNHGEQVSERPYLGIDHVVIRATAAEPLYDLLHKRLGLPVIWPLQYAPFATYGWIGVGNANIEIWAALDNSDLPADCPLPLFHQIALAPSDLEETVAQIRAAGLSCKAPRAFVSKDERGYSQTNFTNSVVLELSSDVCCVFICEWGERAPIAPWRPRLTLQQRRADQRAALNAVGGGRLGLVGLRGIELMTPDVRKATERWQQLSRSTGETLEIANDVDLSLIPGNRDSIQSLTLAVRDFDMARRVLLEEGLLDESDRPKELVLSRQVTGGLRIRLIEELSVYS